MKDEPIRIPITDVFDLHSVPDRDVKAILEEYLSEARAGGFRYLRIIHGRGSAPAGKWFARFCRGRNSWSPSRMLRLRPEGGGRRW